MEKSKTKQKITNAHEDMEKLELLCIASGKVKNSVTPRQKQCGCSSEDETDFPRDPVTLFLGVHPKEWKEETGQVFIYLLYLCV